MSDTLNYLLEQRKFSVGDKCMIHGIENGKPTEGKVIALVDLPGYSGPHYVIEVPTHVDPLLYLRDGIMDMLPYVEPPAPDPKQEAFDRMALRFTDALYRAAVWKELFVGAAYRTRIKSAIKYLREEIAEAEKHPEIGSE